MIDIRPELHVGNYRIVRLLGAGGMGAVYEAVHVVIERRVAIKFLHREYARNPAIITRFFTEARATNRVSHPGLVQVIDFGQLPDGAAFLVMEFLEGVTLSQRLRSQQRLSSESAIRIALPIASALAAAHEKGIVHRDLKPDNIMLIPDCEVPTGERPKILDFGIAKLAEVNGQKTATQAILGTPCYMSPENITSQLSDGDSGLIRGWGLFWD